MSKSVIWIVFIGLVTMVTSQDGNGSPNCSYICEAADRTWLSNPDSSTLIKLCGNTDCSDLLSRLYCDDDKYWDSNIGGGLCEPCESLCYVQKESCSSTCPRYWTKEMKKGENQQLSSDSASLKNSEQLVERNELYVAMVPVGIAIVVVVVVVLVILALLYRRGKLMCCGRNEPIKGTVKEKEQLYEDKPEQVIVAMEETPDDVRHVQPVDGPHDNPSRHGMAVSGATSNFPVQDHVPSSSSNTSCSTSVEEMELDETSRKVYNTT